MGASALSQNRGYRANARSVIRIKSARTWKAPTCKEPTLWFGGANLSDGGPDLLCTQAVHRLLMTAEFFNIGGCTVATIHATRHSHVSIFVDP